MPLVGERLRQVHDLNQDTLAKAEAHAAALLDRHQRDTVSGELLTPPNCAQELHDIVEVHPPNAAAATKMRVAALELDYRRTGSPKLPAKDHPDRPVTSRRLENHPMEMLKATIRSFDADAYTATVQISGSLATWLEAVPVARNIAATATSPRAAPAP